MMKRWRCQLGDEQRIRRLATIEYRHSRTVPLHKLEIAGCSWLQSHCGQRMAQVWAYSLTRQGGPKPRRDHLPIYVCTNPECSFAFMDNDR